MMYASNNLKEVQLAGTGYYLPGNPISFDNIEKVIGELHNIDPNLQTKVNKLRSIMKNILKGCSYLAVDSKTLKPLETNTSLSIKAIKKALNKASMEPEEIEMLVLGTPLSDHMTPSTPPYIQQELGINICTEMEIHSNCTAMTKAMEVAFNALRLGKYRNALVVYSQNPSAYLTSTFYNQDKTGIESVLLRWFLSDAAGACVLKATDKVNSGIKLLETYNESIGKDLRSSMWMDLGAADFNIKDVYERGAHHFSQDYQMVNKVGPTIQVKGLKRMLQSCNLKGKDIDHLLISIPSYKLEQEAKKKTLSDVDIPPEKWFDNVKTKGYCGGASLITSVEELIDTGMFKPGEKTLCFVTESSKWMVGGFVLEMIQ